MKIGCLQFEPALGNYEKTITRLDRLLDSAPEVDLLVLPELANSGYLFDNREHALQSAEKITDSRFINHLQKYCKLRNCHIVSGINERDGDKLYNSSVLISTAGVKGLYRKIHLFWNEKDIFLPGDLGTPVFDIGSCKVGMLVCFDWLFPEVWRSLALKGADIICHPSNLVLPGLCQKATPVHAVINRIFVITSNRIGTEGDLTFTGLSTIADPRANVLVQANSTESVVHVVDVDIALARDKMLTPRNHAFNDRRPECY